MKRFMTKINMALIGIMCSFPAWAEDISSIGGNTEGLCKLVRDLHGVFVVLRTLAFVGAAFVIADWAWGFISKPEDMTKEKLKEKGVALLVGFVLLFIIGVILQFILNAAGPGGSFQCEDIITAW